MSDDPLDLELETLFRAARAAQKQERAKAHAEAEVRRKRKMDPVEPPIEPLGIFVNPDNWIEGRGLALIHRETRLLLGNFRELRHKTVKDARRLVRSLTPIHIDAVEEVDFGLPAETPLPPISSRALVQRIWTGPVALDLPAISCPSVTLCVHYYDHATAKAVLEVPATFASSDEIVKLPAGVDLLSAMSHSSKRALRWDAQVEAK